MGTAVPDGPSAWRTTSVSFLAGTGRPRDSFRTRPGGWEGSLLPSQGATDRGQRRLRVTGAPCARMPPPSFLPQVAEELDAVRTDPERGGGVGVPRTVRRKWQVIPGRWNQEMSP